MAKRLRPTLTCAKRMKISDDSSHDWISQLPDDVLVYILSLLSNKEAARASTLSRRWRHLWTYITYLNFDAQDTLEYMLLHYDEGKKMLDENRHRYINWVNQVSKSYNTSSSTLEALRIRFDLDSRFARDIDQWVRFAIKRKVKKFELDLSCCYNVGQIKPYFLPSLLCKGRVLRSRMIDFSGCTSLTVLRLKAVDVSGELLEYLLSNCPFLEAICVRGCNSLVNLKVIGSSLKLKQLDICRCHHLVNLEISAPNLESFKYDCRRISMPLLNAPKLIEMSILLEEYREGFIFKMFKLSRYCSQLQKLTLGIHLYDDEEQIDHIEYPVFSNLKELELKVVGGDGNTLLGFTSLIKASPFLQKFSLKLDYLDPYSIVRVPNQAARCPHDNIKVVEFAGFVGNAIDIELAMFFIENAVALEKIILDARKLHVVGTMFEAERNEETRAGRRRAKKLRAVLPKGVELVVL